MSELKKAIDEFQKEQLEVYRAQHKRITRDANSVKEAISSHRGRWPLELIQNSDDAKARRVLFHIAENEIWVADDGEGFPATAVESICGTHLSNKPAGNIGRKGVGFKAVYEVTRTPKIFTKDRGGLEFCLQKAEEWFKCHLSNLPGKVPYEWIPFFISPEDIEKDTMLSGLLSWASTVINLKCDEYSPEQAIELINNLEAFQLLPFANIQKIEFVEDENSHYIAVKKNDDAWEVNDSRKQSPEHWKVLRERAITPPDILSTIDKDDHDLIKEVSFLVAAPIDDDGVIRPLKEEPNIHVFYETKERSPIRVLLHAEYLVKGDRTAMVEGLPFNDWVTDNLAGFIVNFVESTYNSEEPSAYIRILKPWPDLSTHKVTKNLWDNIVENARSKLKLPDCEGRINLSLNEAHMLNVTTSPEKARQIVEWTSYQAKLLHCAFDDDTEAMKALTEFGCSKYSDCDIINIISRVSPDKLEDHDWIWNCWEWLADVFAGRKAHYKLEGFVELVRSVPILPIRQRLLSLDGLSEDIVTWRTGEDEIEIPDWLPLTYIDDWFRDRFLNSGKDHSIRGLFKALSIKRPDKNTIKEATEKAIIDYWQKEEGDPARFITFLINADIEETARYPGGLRECPVLADIVGGEKPKWVRASNAYFGELWDNHLLADLYSEIPGVPWVKHHTKNTENERLYLEWLGTSSYPRICKYSPDEHAKSKERNRIIKVLPRHTATDDIPEPTCIDYVELKDLSSDKVVHLMLLLSKDWDNYYGMQSTFSFEYKYHRWQGITIDSSWWYEIKTQIIPPLISNYSQQKPLKQCWLPVKSKVIDKFMPVVDLEAFGDENNSNVRSWLAETVGIRSGLHEIDNEEWCNILTKAIPGAFTLKDKPSKAIMSFIYTCYKECLESLDDKCGDKLQNLCSVPLLCQRGDEWSYVEQDERCIVDNNEYAEVFKEEIWQLELSSQVITKAQSIFGLSLLSDLVSEELLVGKVITSPELDQCLVKALPYIYVWYCHKQHQTAKGKKEILRSIKARTVEDLKARLTIRGIAPKVIERVVGVEGNAIYINLGRIEKKRFQQPLGEAIAKILERKDDEDFYTILLGCEDEEDLLDKLIHKDIPRGEIERLLSEFRGEELGLPPIEEGKTAEVEKEPDAETGEENGVDTVGNGTEEPPTEGDDYQEIEIKDPETSPVTMSDGSVRSPEGPGPDQGPPSGGGEYKPISEESKLEIEQASRKVVEDRLIELGYAVTQMPQRNPGFDIKATKEDVELRIEVKGHLRRGTSITLTMSEHKEYCRQSESIKWELWNVDYLSANADEDMKITRYNHLPNDALIESEFRLNLNQCDYIQ